MDEVFNYPDPVIGVQRTYICDNIKKGVIWSNTQGFCDPEVDKTFAAAALEIDPAKRKALYAEVQKRLADELPVYWLNEIPYTTVYDKRLRNLPLTVWGAMGPFDEVYWGEKTG
jgi:peptide/nickel transport system substrate-binding protein